MCKDIFFKIQNSDIHQLFLGGFYLGNEIVHCQTIILQQAESGGDGSSLCDSTSPLDERIQQGGIQDLHNNKRDAEGRNYKQRQNERNETETNTPEKISRGAFTLQRAGALGE